MCVHKPCTRRTAVTTSRSSLKVDNYSDGGQRSTCGEAGIMKFDSKNVEDFLEWCSELRVSLSFYSKLIFEIVQGSEWSSDLDGDQATARKSWDDANNDLYGILYVITPGPAFSVIRFEVKTLEDGIRHGQGAWAALRKKFDGCLRETLRETHREIEMVKMRLDEDPDDFFCKKGRCYDRLNSVTSKEGPLNRQYEDIIRQCLPPEYDRIRQTHFKREDCNLADIRRMMSKFYADNLARSHSDSSRGIAGRGVAMQATGWGLSNKKCYYCNKFGHYKNDCADFKKKASAESATQTPTAQAARRISAALVEARQEAVAGGKGGNMVLLPQDHYPQRGRFPHQASKQAQQQRPLCPSPSSQYSWNLQLVGSFCGKRREALPLIFRREVRPATKPAKAREWEEKGARPFGPALTAATEG